jgi:transcriptional regulator with XRE-family HTH domain
MPREKSTHVDDPAAVGRRLKEARERAGLSQRQVAFRGCSPAYISRIESGGRTPSLQILRELGERLGVSEDYLATGRERLNETHSRLVEAEVALRLDETETAERLYRDGLGDAKTDRERAEALAGLGHVAFRKGDPSAAIEHLERATELLGAGAEEQFLLADTLGRSYALTGELERAIAVFARSLAAAESRGDAIETMRFAVLLANAQIDMGAFEQAASLLEQISALVDESRDPILRARLYWSRSRLHSEQGDAHTGVYFARRALEILQLTEHEWYTARAYQLLAYTELDRGHAAEAIELLERGWPLLEKTGNELEKAQYRLEEARALAQLGEHERAGALAMELTPSIERAAPEDAGRGFAVLARVYEDLGETARAIELFELAADRLERNPNRFLLDVYRRLAGLLEREDRKDDALRVLQRAIQLPVRG